MSANNTYAGTLTPQLARVFPESISSIIHSTLNYLMISHTFLTLLISLTISLFRYSTPESRRRPVFFLNLAAIFLAFIVGVLIDAFSIYTIFHPLHLHWQPLFGIAIGFVSVWQSMLVNFILLVRLISVYPLSLIGPIRFSLLIAIPVLLKLTRVVNLVLFTAVMIDAENGPNPAMMVMETVFYGKPYLKIEWAAQMIDNTYVSLAFLWKIRDRGNKLTNNVTLAICMQTLSRIALANFVVPTMFSIAQFISLYHFVSTQVLDQLILVNLMLATFGVAFATIWAGNVTQQGVQQLSSEHNSNDTVKPPNAHDRVA